MEVNMGSLIRVTRNRGSNTYATYRTCPNCGKKGLHDYPIKIRNHSEVRIDKYITVCKYCNHEEK